MGKTAKTCRGTWCMGFGFDRPATMEAVCKVLSAFGYDGVELAGFFDHCTVERFPDKESRRKLKSWLNDDLGLEIVGIAPGPYGDLFRLPWATGSREVYDEYLDYFEGYLQLAADMGIPGMRVDPGAAGPLAYGTDYAEVWDRVVKTFQHHAERGKQYGVTMLWELESLQPFNKPSETVKMLNAVGHSHFKLVYDTGHFQACSVIGHNHVQPPEVFSSQLDFIRMLPKDCIGHIHLCDTDMNTHLNMFGTKSNYGEGIMDYTELMPLLAEVYDGEWWAVDSIPMGPKAWEDTWSGLMTLNGMLDTYVRNEGKGTDDEGSGFLRRR